MKTPRSLQETHQGTKWIEEGREQAKESEREGRQRGLAANPGHGQPWTGPYFHHNDIGEAVAGL